MKLAVIGANGFVGSRLVEHAHLTGWAQPVPVVRRVTGLVRSSRFDLEWRLADACDAEKLAEALRGSEAVVHSVVGDPAIIVGAARALVPAAVKAGVKRVVYLSSASVHGQNPPPDTTESSPLHRRHVIAYNNAKVEAEEFLLAESRKAGLPLIALRPSVVFGPRDRWISSLVAELRAGTAWLVENGEGICNTIYVDNLVHAIRCALQAPAEAWGRAFLVGDAETVTWRALYEEVARAIGVDPAGIHRIPTPKFPAPGFLQRLDGLRASPQAQAVIARVPARLKRLGKGLIKAWPEPPKVTSWVLPTLPMPTPTREMVALQQNRWRLLDRAAQEKLGYRPPVSVLEGLTRTLRCLEEAGFVRLSG